MSYTVSLEEWLKHMGLEYLFAFVRKGGSSIKFVVTPAESDASKEALLEKTEALCKERGYLLIKLNAAEMRAHMPQDVFFHLARQIDWRLFARRMILRLAEEQSYKIGGIDPETTGNIFESIATANDLESGATVFTELRPHLERDVLRNPNMMRDFRVGMFQLCLPQNAERHGALGGDPLLDWLTGVDLRIGAVRPFSIYTPINRTTARYFIASTLYWIHHVGCSGTVILFDNSRVTLARNPKDGLRYYTRATAMEHYELLREFVDSVDQLTSTLFVVLTSQDFVDENSTRGYGIYQALRTRVMDDVRDRNMANPIASLVRLG